MKTMYGLHTVPTIIENDTFTIVVDKKGEGLTYNRKSPDGEEQKQISGSTDKLLLIPIEPIHKPKKISEHLLIEFESPLLMAPNTSKKIYIKFPVEIGIITADAGQSLLPHVNSIIGINEVDALVDIEVEYPRVKPLARQLQPGQKNDRQEQLPYSFSGQIIGKSRFQHPGQFSDDQIRGPKSYLPSLGLFQ